MTGAGFTPAQKDALLLRDAVCLLGDVSPCNGPLFAHHRLNRGAGGSKLRNGMGNAGLLCSHHNWAAEADADLAEEARRRGVKLRQGEDPQTTRMWHRFFRQWVQPTDDGMDLLGGTYPHVDEPVSNNRQK